MNFISRLTVITFFIYMAFSACDSKPAGKYDLYGRWSCKIDSRNINGTEIINLSPDSTLVMIDSLRYSAFSSRWGMAVDARIKTSGKWYTRNDSLMLVLEQTEIRTDSSSFSLHVTDFSSALTDELKDSMSADFCTAVFDELSTLYTAGNRKLINLGKIEFLTQDSMLVRNGANNTCLTR